jgi:hypothetical protein
MSKDYREITQSISGSLARYRASQPEIMKGFGALSAAEALTAFEQFSVPAEALTA